MKERTSSYSTASDVDTLSGREVRWTHYIPDDITHSEWQLMVPGFMAGQENYRRLARYAVALGMPFTTMAHSSGSMVCPDEVAELAKRTTDKYQMPVRLDGHSLGGIHSVEAAHKVPDLVSGLTLMQPAGFGGVHPLHAYRSIDYRNMTEARNLRATLRIVHEGVGYVLRSRRELPATVLKASSLSVVEQAAELPDHYTNNAILFENDPLITHREVFSGLNRVGFDAYTLGIPDADHNAQHKYAPQVATMIHDINCDQELSEAV